MAPLCVPRVSERRRFQLPGPLYAELLSTVKQYKADLIVLGTHGKKGLERLLLGSDAEAVLRQAGCPVLSVGPAVPNLKDKTWRIREVICATTLEPRAAEVVAYAHKLAALYEAELVLFHVKSSSEPGRRCGLGFVRRGLSSLCPRGSWETFVVCAPVLPLLLRVPIVDLAKERSSDLIVMGAHPASSAATHLARGTAAKVLAEAACPVMTILQA